MHKFSSLKRAALPCWVWALLLLAASAQAQVKIPSDALSTQGEIEEILQHGRTLEAKKQWGEALTHYEEAYRKHSDRQDLRQRMQLARVHYNLRRRYQDPTFIKSLRELSEAETLDIYAQILYKLDINYYRTLDWRNLCRHGAANLDIALTTPVFLNKHLPKTPAPRIQTFREELRRKVDGLAIRSRYEARDAALLAARMAEESLGLSSQTVLMEFVCGAICALDQYSCFLTRGQLEDVMSQIEGEFVGLGIELKARQKTLEVVGVIRGGPAEEAGVRRGDRIIAVDSKQTEEISPDAAADLLKGPEFSRVELLLEGFDGRRRSLQVTRRKVEVPSVDDIKIVDPQYNIAYFRLASFQKTTRREVDQALMQLHRQKMQGLIVDLRGNPGGLLTASVEAADRFLNDGVIVSTRGRNVRENFEYRAHTANTWSIPLVVLIDEDTASASEIFSGAMRDHNRAVVIGQQSYGKGSVQGIFPLQVGGVGVRMTTAKFYSPNGQAISNRGVTPNMVVRQMYKPALQGETNLEPKWGGDRDLGLQTALGIARQKVVQRSARRP